MLQNRYTHNTLWLLGGQAVKMATGLVASALVARYLGPEQYGVYNYTLSIVYLLQIFGNLGLTGVLRKRCIENPHTVREILGTAFVLNVIAGVILYGGLILTVHLSAVPPTERQLFSIFGTMLIVDSFRCIDVWFHAQSKSRFAVYANILPVLFSAAAKIIAIILGADLMVFAVIFVSEIATVGFLLAFFYHRNEQALSEWKADMRMVRGLLKQSWPLILNGFAISLYLRMDQVMLKSMQGAEAVGEYAAATRLSTIWYMLPMLLASSLTPAILKVRNKGLLEYKIRLQAFMDLNTFLAYLIAVSFSLLSPWIIRFIFGETFFSAAFILPIHVWSCVFVFQGVARNIHIVGQGLFHFSLLSSIIGALVNLGLNFWLIPLYSGTGAAVATLLSQVTSVFILTSLTPSMQMVFKMQCASLLIAFRMPSVFRQWNQLISRR